MTLLTDGAFNFRTDEQRQAAEDAYEKARTIAWVIWFEAYEQGELSLEMLLRYASRSLKKLSVDDFLRWKTLGLLVDKALAVEPKKRSRGNKGAPESLRAIARSLVELAHQKGFVLSRSSAYRSAFEMVADIMADLGIPVTPRQIEEWTYERND